MLTSKLLPRLRLLHRTICVAGGSAQPALLASARPLGSRAPRYTTAADNRHPPRWLRAEPEPDEMLVPRKLCVSPLETWLSLRYSLPPLPQRELPVLEEDVDAPLACKNVLEIRRRKMNRHKYKKLLKRTKFLRRRVRESRGRKKQKRFEKDLKRIWMRAGLKKAPEGWNTPKLFIRQHGNRRN
ncbi:aurora kinase A-interacting protein isoform X2 [Syngnathus acus]|uniref:aurora kinase A-interacting protein isoform X2 n=1 Tax=Syngnathus acus TaxID=161584 RepID=UPI001885D0EB|nr:aurora kinase A-interacting protein isoform X2 [Syngnathus acus]